MTKKQKEGRYERIFRQLEKLLEPHDNALSAMATVAAILHNKMDHFYWTGFYLLDDKGELMVGPYQGTVACIRLAKDTGVCWAAINNKETVIVPDVHKFPGHIACDSKTNSEIVIPLRDKDGKITGVLDVDSRQFNSFDEVDKEGLERIVGLIYNIRPRPNRF